MVALEELGAAFSIFLYFAASYTFWEIFKRRVVEENFSAWPYLATLLNCVMWAVYQLINVYNHSTLILMINSTGALFQVFYVVVALVFSSSPRKRVTILVMLVIKFIIVVSFLIGIVVGVDSANIRTKIVGWAGVACGILMYMSTAPDMYETWRTANIKIVHLLRPAVGLINTIIWLVYGIRQDENFIKIENAFGVALCILQLIVYLIIYKRKCNTPSNLSEVEITSIVTAA